MICHSESVQSQSLAHQIELATEKKEKKFDGVLEHRCDLPQDWTFGWLMQNLNRVTNCNAVGGTDC